MTIDESKINLVIFDSIDLAGDNGEYFYRWVRQNHPKINLLFLLSNRSKDWSRLKDDGFNLFSFESANLIKIFKQATFILWSKGMTRNGLLNQYRSKSIFLQHGTISWLSNIDFYLKSTINHLAGYICSSGKQEIEVIKKYSGNGIQIIPCGLPRRDSLLIKNEEYQKNKKYKQIFISFHWRKGVIDNRESSFKNSQYLQGINDLLNSEQIKSLSESGVKIVFLPHARFKKYLKFFKVPSYVQVGTDKTFQDLLVESDLLITDFSSNNFEMAYMNKPTIMYIPDQKYVKMHMKQYHPEKVKNYKHIFRCLTVSDVLDKVIEFIDDSHPQIDVASDMFTDVDTNNSERLMNWILQKYDKKMSINSINTRKNIHQTNQSMYQFR